MIFFDVTHTSHTRAQTGIQRVVRSALMELGKQEPVAAVCYDPFQKTWREVNASERDHLRPGQATTSSRSAKWPLSAKIAGHARRLLGTQSELPAANGLICPELFSPKVGAYLPELFKAINGPRIAIFHDAIGLKLPELTPAGTVTRLPAYMRELLAFDGIAAVSADSAESLRDFWHWLGVPHPPPVQAIPLGVDPVASKFVSTASAPAQPTPRILCVGTIEGRKNHLALLEACETMWNSGLQFELHLLGLARADTAAAALQKIESLRRAGLPLFYEGAATDAELHAAYARCDFTVYPSMIEGFGLPVIESLQHGKPCICSARGALGESARGGGCIALPEVDARSLQSAIQPLLVGREELAALARVALARKFRSWSDYASDLSAWMKSLPRRD